MIIKAEHIEMPISGTYNERIYDIESAWNTADWCWIQFEEDNRETWCGEFRGKYLSCAIVKDYNFVAVLTSRHLYYVDLISHEVIDHAENGLYRSLYVIPNGTVLITDGYGLEILTGNHTNQMSQIELPIHCDSLEFDKCEGNLLRITCEEFCVWDFYELFLDCESLSIVDCKRIK